MFADAFEPKVLPNKREEIPKWKYFQAFKAGKKLPPLDDEQIRDWFRYIYNRFHELAELQTKLLPMLEYIILKEAPERKTMVEKYYWERTRNQSAYELYARSQYQKFEMTFEITKDNLIYNCATQECEKTRKLNGNTFLTTDSLIAVTVLKLDYVCTRNIQMRRCANCGRWFIPKSAQNRFCNRISPQNPEKTCQEVGPSLVYQE